MAWCFGDNMAMTQFDVVLRGYDRAAVDALVAAVDAAGAAPERIDAAAMQRGGLPIVLRGYDRAQVDAWLARRLVAQPGTGEAESSVIAGPELVIILRGYRVVETDALLATVRSALAGSDPFRRAAAVRAIAAAHLPIGFRGYDRGMIDTYLDRANQALRVR
jgi:hypothetical protein